MQKIFIIAIMILATNFLSACSVDHKVNNQNVSVNLEESAVWNKNNTVDKKINMQISIKNNEKIIVFELNDSQASKDLYKQLPLTIEIEDYSNNEKIFYPPEKLDITDTPLANAKIGTLAYYAPWGDVIIFYDDFGSANGLYELGNVISGGEYIKNISGDIEIDIKED